MGQAQSTSETSFSECEHPGPIQSDNPMYNGNSNHLVPYRNGLTLQQHIFVNAYIRLPPSLDDNVTLDYIRMSKVMFVMRGLPGSGRRVVVQHIQSLFSDAVVCSTSEYFVKCERYEFDPNKLDEAKIFCQEKAQSACEASTHVVVIDNTNMKKSEMKYYFRLAADTRYVVVLVEPWKFNVEQLVQRCHHAEDIEQLCTQFQHWEPIIPLYFGWFLNEADSHMLKLVGMAYLEECLRVPEFAKDFHSFAHASDIRGMLDYYLMPESCKGRMLHCTSKFCSFGDVPGSFEYTSSKNVLEGCGQCYKLCIVGFVMTPRTFGARVKLDAEELKLWDQESESQLSTSPGVSSGVRHLVHSSTHQNLTVINSMRESPWYPHCHATLVSSEELEQSFQPTKGKGSRAHITLGCAEGIAAVTTGYDLLDVIECEETPDIASRCRTFSLPRGWLRDYGKSRWVLYMCREITVSSLFTGYY